MKTNWFKHIHSTKHETSEQYLQSTFWDWAESYKAYRMSDFLKGNWNLLIFKKNNFFI
jgi:hypothetical protein